MPLRFIHENTVLFRKGLVKPPDQAASLDFQMYAFSRLFLRGQIDNLQTSWVKLGVDLAALTLKAGCNDFSGTLMEESITAQAGGDCRRVRPGRPDRREGARDGPRRGRTQHALQKALRKEGSQWRAADHPLPSQPRSITTLAGGVGAAKFLRGLVSASIRARLSVIVNTGDDEEFYGLHVSPDVDTVIYTLAGVVNPSQGWGLEGESFNALERARPLLRQALVQPRRPRPRDASVSAPSGCARAQPLERHHGGNRAALRRQVAQSCR